MASTVRARDLMSHPVKNLTLDVSIREAAAFLLRNEISGALVVDEHDRPVGVFTLRNIAGQVQSRFAELPTVDSSGARSSETGEAIPLRKGFHIECFDDATVGEYMTPGVIAVPTDATVAALSRRMTDLGLHRVFVEDDGIIVGVVTSMDVLRWVGWKRAQREVTI